MRRECHPRDFLSGINRWIPACAGMTILIIFLPFLCGFKFLSALENEQGNKLYKKGQLGKAKNAYLEAKKQDPKAPEVAYNLGNAYFKEESFKDAMDTYGEAARNSKSADLQSRTFYNLGNSLVRQNDNQKAVEFYKQALRLNPSDEDAKYNLEYLMKKDNKQDQQKNQQNQKNQQQNPQNKEDQSKQDEQNQAGNQDQKDKKPQEQPQDGQDLKEDKGEPDKEKQGGEQSSEEAKPDEKKENTASAGEKGGQEEKKEPEAGQEEREVQEAPKPKSDAERRAEQILNALENQEQQVLKLQGGQNKPVRNVNRSLEKDW